MKLTPEQIDELMGKSPEGVYQAIRQWVREEHSYVDKDELAEALEHAVNVDLLDERDIREIEREY
jgi:hypothetical protein